jgi:hypothetical protein
MIERDILRTRDPGWVLIAKILMAAAAIGIALTFIGLL